MPYRHAPYTAPKPYRPWSFRRRVRVAGALTAGVAAWGLAWVALLWSL